MRKRVLIMFLWIFITLVSCSGNSGSSPDSFTFAVISDNHVYKGGFGVVDLEEEDLGSLVWSILLLSRLRKEKDMNLLMLSKVPVWISQPVQVLPTMTEPVR